MTDVEISNGNQQFLEGGDYTQFEEAGTASTSASATPGDKINASKNDDDSRSNQTESRGGADSEAGYAQKIFVGGLSWETTVKDMREYFTKFGPVSDCTLKTDPNTGRSRGFGFVLFEDAASVEKVLSEKGHTLHGRSIDPKRAMARGGREPIKKIFVGGLDPTVPESDIRDHFGKFGKIEEIDLPYDKQKGQRRAFCFITFESEAIVDSVCEQPKQQLGGKEVDVKKATPKNDSGYGYGGGYGGRGRGGFGGGRGRGRGRGGYNQGGGWGGNQGYGGYGNYGNYDYNNYDYNNQGYGNYDYSGYYNQGWGNYNQGYGNQSGYGGGYGNGGYGGGQQGGSYKQKRGGGGHGYHPYSR